MLICISSAPALAQDSTKVIIERPSFLRISYSQGHRDLTKAEMEQILLSSKDPAVVDLAGTEKSYTTVAFIPAFFGGFCVGIGAFAKPANPTLMAAGIISIFGAFVLQAAGDTDLREAITRYNSDVLASPPIGLSGNPQSQTLEIGFSTSF